MKKTLLYSLLVLFLLSFNYKSIDYCFKLSASYVALDQEYDCEEENTESQKSDEKSVEKKDVSEYLSSNQIDTLIIINQLLCSQQSKLLFITSDYSKAVYMPPEKSII